MQVRALGGGVSGLSGSAGRGRGGLQPEGLCFVVPGGSRALRAFMPASCSSWRARGGELNCLMAAGGFKPERLTKPYNAPDGSGLRRSQQSGRHTKFSFAGSMAIVVGYDAMRCYAQETGLPPEHAMLRPNSTRALSTLERVSLGFTVALFGPTLGR